MNLEKEKWGRKIRKGKGNEFKELERRIRV
jgi:hypothetical protein